MSIRTDLELDITNYKKNLDAADRAAVKYARKQERNYQKQQKELKAIETELRRLESVREASNNPKAVRQYTKAIEKLEREQRQLRQETEDYKKSVRQSGDAAQNSAKKSESSFKRMGKAAKQWIAGVAMGALLALGEALRRISAEQIRFDQKMNESLAIMKDVSLATRNEMEKTAREVSKDLNMASDKVAESYYYLASAGMDARQSMQALPAVAEFAKAGMFDMATATDLATDAQSALGLTSENAAENLKNLRRVTDVLVNANQDANASVQQFSEALTNKGATALRNVNKEIEEGAGVLATYADQGIKGRRAGEYLSRTLRIMARAANENKEQFKELGIVTAEGNLADFPTIIQALTQELEGLSDTAMTAKLEQMGFTSEVQEAIKPLIGLSDQVKEYTKSAREAGGATQKVADNQLKSLQERAGKLWNSLKNALGPPLTAIITKTISDIEELADVVAKVYNNISASETEKLIEDLEAAGASPDLIARLKKQDALSDARKLKEDLQKELDSLTVPIKIEEKGFMDKVNSVLDPLFEWRLQGPLERLKDLRKGIQEGLRFEKGDFDTADISKYEQMVSEARENLNQLGNTVTAMKEAGGNVPELLTERIDKYRQQIVQLDKAIGKANQLKNIQQTIDDLQSSDSSGGEPLKGPSKEDIDRSRQLLKMFRENEEWLNMMEGINIWGTDMEVQELGKIVSLVDDLDKHFQKLQQGDYNDSLVTPFEMAAGYVQQYNRALTEANNELASGAITQEQYEQKVKQATDTYLRQIKEIYNSIKDDLTPAQEKAWSTILDVLPDANKEAEAFQTNLDDIADTVDAIINVGDAFGGIGDNARKSLRGVSDLLRGVQNLKEMSDKAGGLGELLSSGKGILNAALPTISMAGGIASMLSGLFTSSEEKNRQAELVNSLKSLERAVEQNTEAFYEESVVGSDISREDLDRGRGLSSSLEGGMRSVDYNEVIVLDDESSLRGIRDRLIELGELFPEIFGDDIERFNNLIEQGKFGEAADLLNNANDRFQRMEENIGDYGDSIAGASEMFSNQIEYGGKTVEEAFNVAADHILNNVAKMEELDQEAINLIKEAKSLDLNTEEGRKRMQEIVKMLFNNPQWRGNMTKEEWKDMLDLFLDSSDGSASGSESSEYSTSLQVARTITDVQANEIVMFLESIEHYVNQIADDISVKAMANGINDIKDKVGRGGSNPLSIPIPLPVTIVDEMPSGATNMTNVSKSSTKKSFNFNGDFHIGGDITERDIDDLTDAMARKFKEQLRGSQF